MPATRKGIYHNLRESKYAVSNEEIAFYFSSMFLLNKFLKGYEENRLNFRKINKKYKDTPFNTDILADINLYKQIEKRGFFVRFKRAMINEIDLYNYALRKMAEKESFEWVCVNGKQTTAQKECKK
jgi:hypothetical protein